MEDSLRFKPQQPKTLSPSTSGRKRRTSTTDSSSPEFEFWRVQNPSFPKPNLVSADELFVDGVILPLRLVPTRNSPSDPPDPNPRPDSEEVSVPGPEPEAQLSAAAPPPAPTASKRWRDIFKKGEKKSESNDKDKDKKKERKSGGATGASSAELNINLWPFSRSRSAGNACTRPKTMFGAPGTRKVNSAPCSRSNSTGESKSTRKWPASPGRAGVHLGRSSPVWQVRRGTSGLGKTSEVQVRNAEKGSKKEAPESRRTKTTVGGGGHGGGAKARVLNLNVPTCIGYRSHLSCRHDVMNSAVEIGGSSGSNNRGASVIGGHGGGGDGNAAGAGSNLFNLRSLFTKKVY